MWNSIRVLPARISQKPKPPSKRPKPRSRCWRKAGAIAERQQIDADLARARLDLEAAQKNYQALDRLVAKQAATRQDLDAARQLVDQLQLKIQALEKSKAALVTGIDKEIAKARLQEAQSAAAVAETNLDLSSIRAPMDGTVYDFDLKQGSYVNPGDLIARIGKLDRVRVTVYVDEPDLGKVHEGEPVIITWDPQARASMEGHSGQAAHTDCAARDTPGG